MAEKKKMKIGLGSFDFAKGIAVLGVILFHMRNRYFPDDAVMRYPAFAMLLAMGSSLIPMFFIISGYGFKEKKGLTVLKKTFSSMILPYFVSIPLVAVLFLLFSYPSFYPVSELFRRLWGLMAGLALGLPENRMMGDFEAWAIVTMWFFLALFVAQNILNLILRVRKLPVQLLLVAVCVLAGFGLRSLEFDFYCIALGMMAVGFCYAGYCLKKYKLIDKWFYSPWIYICLGLITLLLPFIGMFNMASGEYTLLGYFAAGCSGVLMLFAALWCDGLRGGISRWIRKMGMHSFWIIYVHGIERLAMPWDGLAAGNSNLLLTFVIEVGLKVVIIVTGCMIFRKIAQVKLRRVTGKAKILQ